MFYSRLNPSLKVYFRNFRAYFVYFPQLPLRVTCTVHFTFRNLTTLYLVRCANSNDWIYTS